MAVSLYFGLPGCGKTTLLTAFACKAVKKKKYNNIFCNVRICVPGVTYIDNDCIGKYDLSNGLILIDEGTLFADSRAHKEFSKDKIEYFLLHRHYNVDIVIFTQQWDGVDKKIRVITDRVYYVFKGIFTGKWITSYYRIPYGIIIPDPKKDNGEKLGDIVQGYCKPSFLKRLFCPKLYRPKYYKYFDSWECPPRPALPEKYKPFTSVEFDRMQADRKDYAVKKRREMFERIKSPILLRWRKVKAWALDKWPFRSAAAPDDPEDSPFLL